MSKKSNVLNAGREFVLNLAKQDGLDKTALRFGYVRPNGTGNGGALSNVIKELGWRGESAKTVNSGVKPAKAPVAPVAPVLTLPGRIEDYMLDNILPETWNDEQPIPQHFVELVVRSDTADWNKRVRRLGAEEIAMLEAFLGNACTMNRREDAMLEKLARAPFERSQARIDAQAQIDASLANAESRFESSRYDASIVAGYLGD